MTWYPPMGLLSVLVMATKMSKSRWLVGNWPVSRTTKGKLGTGVSVGVGLAVGGAWVGRGVAVAGTGVAVGGMGVDVGEGVAVGEGRGVAGVVGVAVKLASMVGVGELIAAAFRISRGVGAGSSEALPRANHRVTPEPRTTNAVARQSPTNRIMATKKIIRLCFVNFALSFTEFIVARIIL